MIVTYTKRFMGYLSLACLLENQKSKIKNKDNKDKNSKLKSMKDWIRNEDLRLILLVREKMQS
jgi:hypothetical protein